MIYLKEPNTNRIVEFQNQARIGINFKNWEIATESEIASLILEKAKNLKIAQCKVYLTKTDWQAVRLAETNEPMKSGVADNRALARTLQDDINACTTFEELNEININFNL